MVNEQPFLLPPGGGRAVSVSNATIFIKLLSDASGGVMSITEYELPSGFPGPPPHKHKVFEHAWYILAGSVDVLLDAQWQVLSTGSFLFIPKFTVHAFANNSTEAARLLAIDIPGGFERYYDGLEQAFSGGRPIDQDMMREIQFKYDTYPPEYAFK